MVFGFLSRVFRPIRTATLLFLGQLSGRPPITMKFGGPGSKYDDAMEPFPIFKHTPHISPNSRGLIGLDLMNCTGCAKCAKACPNKCIEMVPAKPQPEHWSLLGKKRPLDYPTIMFGRCMFCGLCTEACPFEALYHTPLYEASYVDETKKGLYFYVDRMGALLKEGKKELYEEHLKKWEQKMEELWEKHGLTA